MSLECLKNSEGIALDKASNITYFLIAFNNKEYIGVITGANKVSKNYAYMVSKLLESRVQNGKKELNKQDFFKELLSNKLESYQIQSFKSIQPKDRAFYVITILSASKDKSLFWNTFKKFFKSPMS